MREKIVPITNYENFYAISNYGYVISYHHKKQHILKPMKNKGGYLFVQLSHKSDWKNFQLHALVWDHFGNEQRNGHQLEVDHIDGNKLNNHINNLQILSARQNSVKYRETQKTSSKYIGVCRDKRRETWYSRIRHNGKQIYLGSYKNEYDAYLAYQKALKVIV